MWAVSTADEKHYWISQYAAVAGRTDYSLPWNVNWPAGSYRLRVSFGTSLSNWLATDYSDAAFSITDPVPTLTVTAPNGGESYVAGSSHTLSWTTSPAQTLGIYMAWAVSTVDETHTYFGDIAAVPGQTSYSMLWAAGLPVGNYRMRVSYGFWPSTWLATDYSDSSFTLTQPVPTYTITPTAGPNGSISPATPQNVPSGGSQSFTITPNPGYHVRDVLVNGGSVGAVTSYTFTNVTATHTIDATFETNSPSIGVTAPTGGSYGGGGPLTVAWTPTPGVLRGEFAVWVRSAAGSWYGGKVVAATGAPSSSTSVTLNVPSGSGYYAVLAYRTAAGTAWVNYANSPGTFTVAGLASISVTAPTGSGSYSVGAALMVSWRPSSAITAGQFGVWVRSASGIFYGGKVVAATGAATYTTTVNLSVPAGSGYYAVVAYRSAPGTAWTNYTNSPGVFSVN